MYPADPPCSLSVSQFPAIVSKSSDSALNSGGVICDAAHRGTKEELPPALLLLKPDELEGALDNEEPPPPLAASDDEMPTAELDVCASDDERAPTLDEDPPGLELLTLLELDPPAEEDSRLVAELLDTVAPPLELLPLVTTTQ